VELQLDSAPGPDRVWTKVLHRLADTIAAPLAVIFAKLLDEGNVPQIWKDALVCPIFKKGKKGDAANYRPVSLTCVLGKVMEKVMRDPIRGDQQQQTCWEYLEKLTELLDKGENFDSVPKERLLRKLEGVGVWIKEEADVGAQWEGVRVGVGEIRNFPRKCPGTRPVPDLHQ
jgi:hypothetical protein